MTNAARDAGVIVRRIHLVVAIDRLLARLLVAAPGQWIVKGGYANQLRRPDHARFTEDLDLKIDAAIEAAPELLASGVAIDLADDFSYEVATPPAALESPPGGGLRFVVVARLAGTELVRFKVDVSAADVVVGDFALPPGGRSADQQPPGRRKPRAPGASLACGGRGERAVRRG